MTFELYIIGRIPKGNAVKRSLPNGSSLTPLYLSDDGSTSPPPRPISIREKRAQL